MYSKKRRISKKSVLLFFILALALIGFSAGDSIVDKIKKEVAVQEDSITDEGDNIVVEEVKPVDLKLMFAGDVMMASYFADYINDYGVDYSWTSVSHLTKEADAMIINLETAVSDRGETTKPEGYGFRSEPRTVEGLVNAGVDVVNLANNHTNDFGPLAFEDTLNTMDVFDIAYVGAGFNKEEATGLKTIERNGLTIGFLGYTDIIPSSSWIANDTRQGIAAMNTIIEDQSIVSEAKKNCDILFVMLHWGIEYSDEPTNKQIELAHKIIDAGADGIVGHHPHVLQGIEIYNDKPIIYSTGNFIFLKKDENAGKTAVFELNYKNDQFDFGKIHPVYISKCVANLIEDTDPMRDEIIKKVKSLSLQMNTEMDESGGF